MAVSELFSFALGARGPIIIGQPEGQPMRTTILAYVIALAGLVMIAAGVWGLFILRSEIISDREEMVAVPVSDYAIAIGMISGGLAMIGLAQALRLLLVVIKNTR
jgi:hypothetical protein